MMMTGNEEIFFNALVNIRDWNIMHSEALSAERAEQIARDALNASLPQEDPKPPPNLSESLE